MTRTRNRIGDRESQAPGSVWSEDNFRYLLEHEQRRSRRSRNPVVLVILTAAKHAGPGQGLLQMAVPAVASSTRETDVVGWIEKPSTLGVIFTCMDSLRMGPNLRIVRARLERALQDKLGRETAANIALSSHICGDPLENSQFDSSSAVAGQSLAIQ
jgi:hypothetical protein